METPAEQLVTFLRRKDFVLKKELGGGACGKTVLLHDTLIDEHFVCKKYAPADERWREELFKNFVREIKLLHRLHHRNVVRIFNYYLYPQTASGYIVMEFIDGRDIEDFVRAHPEEINEIFSQAIEGFSYLEANDILHRDIRPQNVMVTNDGTLKVIDFGFGKLVRGQPDFDKSITLNWWCEPPPEFSDQQYDFCTEVYFVGNLFKKLIADNAIEEFRFQALLDRMCSRAPAQRSPSFAHVRAQLLTNEPAELVFSSLELDAYRALADALYESVSKIENATKFVEDIESIQGRLESLYKSVMLERIVPNIADVSRCFLSGEYYFRKGVELPVKVLKAFVDLLKKCPLEKKNIVLANLHRKLDQIPKYQKVAPPKLDDDIPF